MRYAILLKGVFATGSVALSFNLVSFFIKTWSILDFGMGIIYSKTDIIW
ncbi:hypothetical protein SAMN04488104_10253 [Algoriphagus faecimaris]|uniref:Uncharacterized protein n=1 Tax=Algoriphagus faecimaris TaxID=686796 RepID=A0A1G6TZD2_9BACT|nr:hypothetical protein SAMN04488104_10253 [Algoriphagus faecimaris]